MPQGIAFFILTEWCQVNSDDVRCMVSEYLFHDQRHACAYSRLRIAWMLNWQDTKLAKCSFRYQTLAWPHLRLRLQSLDDSQCSIHRDSMHTGLQAL